MIIEEINIICMNGKKYRFPTDTIQHWDFDFKPDILRIDLRIIHLLSSTSRILFA